MRAVAPSRKAVEFVIERFERRLRAYLDDRATMAEMIVGPRDAYTRFLRDVAVLFDEYAKKSPPGARG